MFKLCESITVKLYIYVLYDNCACISRELNGMSDGTSKYHVICFNGFHLLETTAISHSSVINSYHKSLGFNIENINFSEFLYEIDVIDYQNNLLLIR